MGKIPSQSRFARQIPPFVAARHLPPTGGSLSSQGELFASAGLRRQSSPLRGSWQSRQALTERVGSLPEGAGAAQAASEGVHTA